MRVETQRRTELLIETLPRVIGQRRTLEEALTKIGISIRVFRDFIYEHGSPELRKLYAEIKEARKKARKLRRYSKRAWKIRNAIDEGNMSYGAIGRVLGGITRERVRQIIMKIESLYEQRLYPVSLYDYLRKRKGEISENRARGRARLLEEVLEEAKEKEMSFKEIEEKRGASVEEFLNFFYTYPEYSEELKRLYERLLKLGKERRKEERQAKKELAKNYSEQGISREKIARRLGVSAYTVYRYLRGFTKAA